MQLRLGFSIALEMKPDIFLIDEVLAVGDEHLKSKCLWRLGEERQAGRTFLIATHNLQFIEEACDRAALLVEGRVAALGGMKEVLRCYHGLLAGEGSGSSRGFMAPGSERPRPRKRE